ncbi:hypothetical protein [Algoriphagus chordae]|uniref:DUF4221 domain-containing protein n=1 Tax=Algoriphagus chordae TaxID=237019 RepID=A0A2W7RL72_9BACT|nr:hypothetical protein [Algoriphagus chordae]PZX51425.1 hypothetical protein LV85_02369 [Algoriphagus chordae]
MKRLILSFAIVLVNISCSQKSTDSLSEPADFHLEIIDSIRIDYLGDLWMIDFDSASQSYLARGNRDMEFMILDRNGLTKSTLDFPTDGPYALNGWLNPIGLRDEKIEFQLANQGFFRYDFNGNRIWQYKLPYDYFYVSVLSGDAIYPLGDEIAFIRPERPEIVTDESLTSIFEGIYGQPILQVFDTLTNVSRETMPFPPNSMYSDGNLYLWMYPTVIQSGKEWLLYFRNEMKFWVYREEGGEVVFDKEVSLEVHDVVKPIGVLFEQEEVYNSITKNNFPGTIREIYKSNDKTFVIYTKGISEELTREIDRDEPDGQRELEKLSKYFVAVFDSEFHLIQNEIPVPSGLVFTTILTEEEEILALKNQDYFGVEEDFVIYYKLKLLN